MSRKISEFNPVTTLNNSDIFPFVDLTEPIVADKNKNITFANLKDEIINPDTLSIFINGSVSNKEYSLILKTPYSFNILQCTSVLASGSCTIKLNSFNSQTVNIIDEINTVAFEPNLNIATNQNLKLTVTNGSSPIDLSITLLIKRL